MPPTTPPAIAPVFDDEEDEEEAALLVEALEEGVFEADVMGTSLDADVADALLHEADAPVPSPSACCWRLQVSML